MNTTKVGEYVFKQEIADNSSVLRWKVQGITSADQYITLGPQAVYDDIGHHYVNFTIPRNVDLKGFRFGLNGTTIDTLASFYDLTPGDYTLSFDLDNNIQGEVEFSHIQILYGHNNDKAWIASYLDRGQFVSNTKLYLWSMDADLKPNYTAKIIYHVKLEYGNVPTDWSPAPEDKADKTLSNVELSRGYFSNGSGYYLLPNGMRFQWNKASITQGLSTRTIYTPYGFSNCIYAGAVIVNTTESGQVQAVITKVTSGSIVVRVSRSDGMELTGTTEVRVFVVDVTETEE